MKDSASYKKLWQAKMQDFPLEGDANTAWEKMAGSLDTNMPVIKPVPGAAKPWSFIGSKFFIAAVAFVSALSIIYLAYHFNAAHHQKHLKPGNKYTGQVDSATQATYKSDSASNHIKTIKQNTNEGNNPPSPGSNSNHNDSASNKGDVNHTKNSGPSKVNNAVNGVAPANIAASASLQKQAHPSGNNNRRKRFNGQNANYSVPNKKMSNEASVSGSQTSANHVNTDKPSSGLNGGPSNKVNTTLLANKTSDTADTIAKNTLGGSAKINDSTTANKPVKQTPADTTKKKSAKPASIAKNKANNKSKVGNGNSGFELEVKTGFNTNKNTSVVPMLGIAGAYYFTPRFSVGIGANLLSYRLIGGTYSNSIYGYTTAGDSGKIIQHTADKLTISSTAKLYTIDIPILADYKITNWLSVKAGPVFSFPLKKATVNSTLGSISNPADTLSAYKTIISEVNNTTLKNDVNIGFSTMLTLSFKRFNINGGYLQSLGPYNIGSPLGKTSAYYRSFHFGISYIIFQPKKKKK